MRAPALLALTLLAVGACAMGACAEHPASPGGALAITVAGLPDGTPATVRLSRDDDVRQVTAPITVDGLDPGDWQVVALPATAPAGTRYLPVRSTRTITVERGVAFQVPFEYAAVTGAITLAISGLPTGASATLTLTGPAPPPRTLAAAANGTATLANALTGRWRVEGAPVRWQMFTWAAAPVALDTLLPSADTLRLPVRYAIATGALAVSVTGLPEGTAAAVRVTGPGTFRQQLTASTTLVDLTPGSYAVSGDTVLAGGTRFRAAAVPAATVPAGTTAVPVAVRYDAVRAPLGWRVSGLPAGTVPTVRVQGPLLLDQGMAADAPRLLPVGTYTITAPPLRAGGVDYLPEARVATLTLPPAGDSVTLRYRPATGPLNLVLDQVWLMQAVQRPDGSVPLVAGREALLRAFVRADRATAVRPPVRARLFDGPTLLRELALTPPAGGIPVDAAEGDLAGSYTARVPAELVRPALRLQVEVDPDSTAGEAQRADNRWPATGTRAMTVQPVTPMAIRLVPVALGGATGSVAAATVESYLRHARLVWPLQEVLAEVRAPYASTLPALQGADQNGSWSALLTELNALRAADGAPASVHYYGVVRPPYATGVTGMGLVGGRVAVGWDATNSRDTVVAHELGHNFGRQHAPCGIGTALDPSYPTVGGAIGAWGWNAATNALLPPTTADLMGYCTPSWISDYHWGRVLATRAAAALTEAPGRLRLGAPQPGLLVWGRIVRGTVQLEPAFQLDAPATPASATPTHEAVLRDGDGTELGRWPLDALPQDHAAQGDTRQFAAVVPLDPALANRVAEVTVRPLRPGGGSTGVATGSSAGAIRHRLARDGELPAEQVTRTGTGAARATWDAARFPMALMLDPGTGRVLGMLRGGSAPLPPGGEVELHFSDGVRTVTRRVRR